jgi:hypothetical protein
MRTLKENIHPRVVASNYALRRIIVGCRISLAEKIEAPILERHASLLCIIKAPLLPATDRFEGIT